MLAAYLISELLGPQRTYKVSYRVSRVLKKFAANLLIILQEWAETEKDLIKGDDKL